MSADIFLTNQTQFSIEEPIREEKSAESHTDGPHAAIPQKKSKKIVVVIVVVIVIFLLCILLLAASSRKQISGPIATPEASVTPSVQQDHPLLGRVNRLRSQLDIADPTKQPLLFPPVDLTIRLDEPTN